MGVGDTTSATEEGRKIGGALGDTITTGTRVGIAVGGEDGLDEASVHATSAASTVNSTQHLNRICFILSAT
jgi:hypothetical protein